MITHEHILQSRRNFLATSASGIGMLALASLLQQEGLLAAESAASAPRLIRWRRGRRTSPPRPRAASSSTWKARPARSTCSIPSPSSTSCDGQPLPESMTKNVRFAFIQKETARLMGSPRKFTQARPVRHGAVRSTCRTSRTCADDIALIRSMHTDAVQPSPRPAADEHAACRCSAGPASARG